MHAVENGSFSLLQDGQIHDFLLSACSLKFSNVVNFWVFCFFFFFFFFFFFDGLSLMMEWYTLLPEHFSGTDTRPDTDWSSFLPDIQLLLLAFLSTHLALEYTPSSRVMILRSISSRWSPRLMRLLFLLHVLVLPFFFASICLFEKPVYHRMMAVFSFWYLLEC